MNSNGTVPWQLVLSFVALMAFTACNSADTLSNAETRTGTNANIAEEMPVEITEATGTIVGMALPSSTSSPEEYGPLTLIYLVKLEDGKQVSAKSPRQPGQVISDDRGKRVELESLAGEEAEKARAEWKIVRFIE